MTWNGGNADVPAGSNPDVTDGEIHHFVGVSTVDAVFMYMNGELVAEGPPPAVENNSRPVMIGENPDARNRTWSGMIDDVAIWGRGLTEGEVAFLWNNGKGRKPTEGVGLVGDYNANGTLDSGDLDLQSNAIAANGPALYDLNKDGSVNFLDRKAWVNDLKKTWVGDANLDGLFNTTDFVNVFQVGKFETGAAASWTEGDWDGNKLFTTGDFVVAFQAGGFEAGPKAAVSAVPEPSSMMLGLLGLIGMLGLARRR